jgi:hypothetical protein
MSDNVVRLPEAVPEGWALTGLGVWEREGLKVWYSGANGAYFVHTAPLRERLRRHPTLPEACAAAERAFCGCYVGRSVPWLRWEAAGADALLLRGMERVAHIRRVGPLEWRAEALTYGAWLVLGGCTSRQAAVDQLARWGVELPTGALPPVPHA